MRLSFTICHWIIYSKESTYMPLAIFQEAHVIFRYNCLNVISKYWEVGSILIVWGREDPHSFKF